MRVAFCTCIRDTTFSLHFIHSLSSPVLVDPLGISPHTRRNSLKDHVSASPGFFDPRQELLAPRLVVEEYPWVAEVPIELLLQASYTVYCFIDIGIPREHQQGSIRSRSGIEDGCLTADMEGRVKICFRTDNGEAPDM